MVKEVECEEVLVGKEGLGLKKNHRSKRITRLTTKVRVMESVLEWIVEEPLAIGEFEKLEGDSGENRRDSNGGAIDKSPASSAGLSGPSASYEFFLYYSPEFMVQL
ncbi:conserved hypothetical protein [Ricinus communis]|uniref:Uncharacterized protein n=1 Tax=Ricinus communis TaxID=3988 RepID=B9RVE9_RICCO|nr:conserved hypothetical protein [Ricinus communis]